MQQPNPTLALPRRILVRGVNWLGDAVMTTPALHRLRETFPRARITLLTHEKLRDLWLHHPALDCTLTFSGKERLWSVARRLGTEQFDLALIFPNSPRSALEAWLGQVPNRVGYARPWRNWFLTQAVPPRSDCVPMRKRSISEIKRLAHSTSLPIIHNPSTCQQPHNPVRVHQIYEYLHLVSTVGAAPDAVPPHLEVTSTEMAKAQEALQPMLRQIGHKGDAQVLVLGVNPGAEYGPAKRWPIENFAAVLRQVCSGLPSCVWLVFGAAQDKLVAEELAKAVGPRAINLAGKTSLRELMSLLKLCRLLLTNDSGPMHVAAALGTKVVALFGSTSPELTAPGLPGTSDHLIHTANVPCNPCFRRTCPIDLRCLTGISPEQVTRSILSSLNAR